jgi:xylitol oxidase
VQLTNWARNVVLTPERFVRPGSVEHVQELVAGADRVRVLGTGHSFSEVAATDGLLLSLAELPLEVDVDTAASTVRVSAGARFGDLMRPLAGAGLALHNTGSLPHISVAGACATGTHGSGSGNACLAAAVVELDLVGPDGVLHTASAGDPGFDGSVVALGLLGVVTSLTLRAQPTYDVRQYVYDDLPLDALVSGFDEVMDSAFSVSAFTRWRGPTMEMLWRKQLADAPEAPATWLGAHLADGPRHPVAGMPVENATQQLGVPGAWFERLPHFRLEFTPSSGDEVQSEYLLPRSQAADALKAVDAVRDAISPAVQVSEVRTAAADRLWLSPAYGRPTVGLHFTWVDDPAVFGPAVAALEGALEGFEARPHWGKIFGTDPGRVRAMYPKLADFEALARRHDPEGTFTNAFVSQYLELGGAASR